MDVLRQVRRSYDRWPYPQTNSRRPRWLIAPMKWINALWRSARPAPGRILVAGCGTGMEAWALARKFPGAEITGVDFSARSIAVAREWRRRAAPTQRIRFRVGDLAGPSFA